MKIVDSANYIEKSKKGAIELIGFKMKELEIEESISKKEVKSEKEVKPEKEVKSEKELKSEKEVKPESISKKETKVKTNIEKKGQIINEVDFFSQEEEPKCNLIIDFVKEEVINEIVVKHKYNESKTKQKPNNKLEKKIYYFDEKKDKKILHEYTDANKNIMMLSADNNVRPWEVVSLLMKHKVIAKRGDALGYDIYKETDEYKNKITK
jgi:hypothetical protein